MRNKTLGLAVVTALLAGCGSTPDTPEETPATAAATTQPKPSPYAKQVKHSLTRLDPYVSVMEADGTSFVIAGHPAYGAECTEIP